jgi:Amt family ammonium transporter
MGWFGFNPGSSFGITGDGTLELSSRVFITTNLAAASAATVTMIITWFKYGKPDVSMTLNGVLAGLVAITAGCDVVSPLGAAIIGCISAFAMVYGIEFIDKVLKVDDPVGAIGVHCINGVVGTILTGVFAMDGGLFYGGGFKFLGVQCLGVAAVAIWSVATATILFKGIKATIGLRVTREEEIRGLDIEEHGLESSYADFQSVDINM